LPPLTEERMAQLRTLAGRPDDEIDCSDIPEWTEDDWARSVIASDFPSAAEALQEAKRLRDMQKAGTPTKDMESCKAARVMQAAGV